MRFKLAKLSVVALMVLFIILSARVLVTAITYQEYTISAYDVDVRVLKDGSLDITEHVSYTSFGSYNNTVILIDKREGEEIEIKSVLMQKKNGFIACEQLSAGQWDANVFSGTYSVINEKDLVRVKVYGNFSGRYGSIIVNYHVKNAIKRYGDVAEYRRTHIQKGWEGRISNINISVSLPYQTDPSSMRPFLHGVIVGRKRVENTWQISFNVPDTVPGEYVEARIVFPESIVYKAPVIDKNHVLDTILREEKEYDESDKTELLKARENAAREAGRRAWSERMKQRARRISTIFSILASALGLYAFIKIRNKISGLEKLPASINLNNIEMLKPSEVRMLMSNGKTGARAFLGAILNLASLGYTRVNFSKDSKRDIMKFSDFKIDSQDKLSNSESFLLEWISGMADDTGLFSAENIKKCSIKKEDAAKLKRQYIEWENRIIGDYSEKYELEPKVVFYRNLGLVLGVVLFFLGCFIPVSLSIWAGYLMLPVGLILLLYSIRIRKHTDFGIAQHKVWRNLKRRIINRSIALDSLPTWINGSLALLGYIIALGAEKELELVIASIRGADDPLERFKDDEESLYLIVKQTLKEFNYALSSFQDLV